MFGLLFDLENKTRVEKEYLNNASLVFYCAMQCVFTEHADEHISSEIGYLQPGSHVVLNVNEATNTN